MIPTPPALDPVLPTDLDAQIALVLDRIRSVGADGSRYWAVPDGSALAEELRQLEAVRPERDPGMNLLFFDPSLSDLVHFSPLFCPLALIALLRGGGDNPTRSAVLNMASLMRFSEAQAFPWQPSLFFLTLQRTDPHSPEREELVTWAAPAVRFFLSTSDAQLAAYQEDDL